jgi:hypothetical protein
MQHKAVFLKGKVITESGAVYPLNAKYQDGETLLVEASFKDGVISHKRISTSVKVMEAYLEMATCQKAEIISVEEFVKLRFLGEKVKLLFLTPKGLVVQHEVVD